MDHTPRVRSRSEVLGSAGGIVSFRGQAAIQQAPMEFQGVGVAARARSADLYAFAGNEAQSGIGSAPLPRTCSPSQASPDP